MQGMCPAQRPRRAWQAVLLPALVGLLCDTAHAIGPESNPAGGVEFGRDIRPILANNCFKCHGPDDQVRKGGLRLHTRAGATEILADGAAIVPGDPDASNLLARVMSDEPDYRMPPPDVSEHIRDHIETELVWYLEGA